MSTWTYVEPIQTIFIEKWSNVHCYELIFSYQKIGQNRPPKSGTLQRQEYSDNNYSGKLIHIQSNRTNLIDSKHTYYPSNKASNNI